MTIWKFTPANSRLVATGHALDDSLTTVSGGSLTVDAEAYLVSRDGGYGAYVKGFTNIVVNGAIAAYGAGTWDALNALVNKPTDVLRLNVGASGLLYAGGMGAGFSTDEVTNITNAGRISGNWGVKTSANGNFTITNTISGVIESHFEDAIYISGSGVHTIVNSGFIDGPRPEVVHGFGINAFTSSGSVKLTNTGGIRGTVLLGGGDDVVTMNAGTGPFGTGMGAVVLGAGNDTVTINKGTVLGVDFGPFGVLHGMRPGVNAVVGMTGKDTLIMNGGDISGAIDFTGDVVGDVVTMAGGTIAGDVAFGAGADLFKISNGTISGAIQLAGGADLMTMTKGTVTGELNFGTTDAAIDKLTMSGGVIDSGVLFGDGADVATLTGGKVTGSIHMGDGADQFSIGAGVTTGDVVLGGGADPAGNIFKMTGGLIDGSVAFGTGADLATLSGGTIASSIDFAEGANTFTMSNGSVGGLVTMGRPGDTAVNTLTLTGGVINNSVSFGDGADVATIGSTIHGMLTMGDGADTVTMNKGFVLGVLLGEGDNVMTVKGGEIHAGVNGGDGADRLTVTAGKINFASLGGGADTFVGGAAAEMVYDGSGADSYNLGGGDDIYYAAKWDLGVDGVDTIDGGLGVDRYDAFFWTANPVTINIGGAVDLGPVYGVFPGNSASGLDVGDDVISNFENASGGDGDDMILGSASANVLKGKAGADTIYGGAGADTLYGHDSWTPPFEWQPVDAAADTFVYKALSDSGVTAATRDAIRDFTVGVDKIDLSLIDADTLTPADQAFAFLNPANPLAGFVVGAGGQLKQTLSAGGSIVWGDVNGDAKADFSIQLAGVTSLLSNADFIG